MGDMPGMGVNVPGVAVVGKPHPAMRTVLTPEALEFTAMLARCDLCQHPATDKSLHCCCSATIRAARCSCAALACSAAVTSQGTRAACISAVLSEN